MELVTGASGYVGHRLVRRLVADGRAVRALVRDPARLQPTDGVEVAVADLLSGEGLRRALDGCAVAYYLVHSMEAGTSSFADRDRRAAERFVTAAADAGVERIVYLGGLAPASEPHSAHIASRLEVERILMSGPTPATALRASILIGAHSSSFRILVRLVERMPVLPLPAWRTNRTRPIAERDALRYLARAPEVEAAADRSLDIAGPEVISYGQLVGAIAEGLGVGRAGLGLGFSLTPPASAVVAAVTGQPLELVRPLMESLEQDLLPRSDEAAHLLGVSALPVDRAVDRALAEWEIDEELAAR